MIRISGRLKSIINELGRLNGTLYLVASALSRISGGRCRLIRYALTVQPLADIPRLPERRGRQFTVREIGSGETELLMRMGRPMAVIDERFAQGAVCLGLFRDEDLAGFAWFVIGPYREDEVRCLFEPLPEGRTAWDFDVFVDSRFRLSPAFVRLWGAVADHLQAHGCGYTASRISTFNSASMSSHRRMGARSVATANFLCLGRLQLMISGLPPYLHVGMRSASRPILRVAPSKDLPDRVSSPVRAADEQPHRSDRR